MQKTTLLINPVQKSGYFIIKPMCVLQVWFEITLHFCHKGAEAQEKLKKTTFAVFSDRNGLRYVARNSPGMTDDDEVHASGYAFAHPNKYRSFSYNVLEE